jgi:glucan 1,3-beta-glucosidase
MREGALPSPSNQARVVQEVLGLAAQKNYRVNVIEAYDQPWKRQMEGTVGGHWGLIPADRSAPKFLIGEAVSDHPWWRWQAGGGGLLAAAVVGAALWRRRQAEGAAAWIGVAAIAAVAGLTVPWTMALVPVESLGIGGWLRWVVLAMLAMATPLLGAAALTGGDRVPTFAHILGGADERPRDSLVLVLGIVAAVTTVLAIQTALGLVFDARYRDLPFAPMSAAIVPLVAVSLRAGASKGAVGVAERLAGAILAAGAVYIVINESFANWQAVWVSVLLLGLALTLFRQRDARS